MSFFYKTAIEIQTEKWNEIVAELKNRNWVVVHEYEGLDKGLDHDFLILKEGKRKIYFGWSNYFEGEMRCSDELFDYIQDEFEIALQFGKPTSLKIGIILLEKLMSSKPI